MDTITCRCDAQVEAPAEGTVVTCPSCGGQWFASPRAGGNVFVSPEHAAQLANPQWTSGRPRVNEVVTISYEASVPLYFPETDTTTDMYGASYEQWAKCGHKHETYEAAEQCGKSLQRTAPRKRNKAGR